MSGRIAGKVALVTGGANGIGAAIAERFAREGARLMVADQDVAAATALAHRIGMAGGHAHAHKTDVRERTEVEGAVAAAVALWGRLDILVANAGIMSRAPFLDMTDELWSRIIGINLTGVFLSCQTAARQMVQQGSGGCIVTVASNSGVLGGNGRSAYGASKAGIINMTQSMAIELARHRIRVNCVAPGIVKTRPEQPEKLPGFIGSRMPLGRYGRPDEIAAVALFLASDEASFVTGHTYRADGGFTIFGMPDP